jgi:diacylglycerol kinase
MPTILDEVTFRKLVIRALLVIICGLFTGADKETINVIIKDLGESLGK